MVWTQEYQEFIHVHTCSVNVWVSVVLKRILLLLVSSWHFDNLSRSHLQSRVKPTKMAEESFILFYAILSTHSYYLHSSFPITVSIFSSFKVGSIVVWVAWPMASYILWSLSSNLSNAIFCKKKIKQLLMQGL